MSASRKPAGTPAKTLIRNITDETISLPLFSGGLT
jgi:hypothetical protein